MAFPFYLELTDESGSQIQGDPNVTGGTQPPSSPDMSKNILCLQYNHTVAVPTVGGTQGLSSNQAVSQGVIWTKFTDAVTPILFGKMGGGKGGAKTLQKAVFHFFMPDKGGALTEYYTVTLTNLLITSIVHSSDHSASSNAQQSILQEDITFSFTGVTYAAKGGQVSVAINM